MMRKTILAAVAASAITGAAAGSMIQLAAAQPAQGQMPPAAGVIRGPEMPMRPGMRHPGSMHRMHARPGMHGPFGPGTFALFYRHADRQLSGAEVRKIAEALLLWHGNRSWKVADLVESPDSVAFAFAGTDGMVIAKFSMDRRSGRITRVG